MSSIGKGIFATVALLIAAVGLAFAETKNPFAEIPLGHWTYDALAQLEPLAGAPSKKENERGDEQPMTRFEMARILALVLNRHYIEDLDERDAGTLKRLVVEFDAELNALGVPTDDLEHRKERVEEMSRKWFRWSPVRITVEMLSNDIGCP